MNVEGAIPEDFAPQPPSAGDADDLSGKFARGIAWTGLAKAVSQGLGWVATLIVARYLLPTDYALFGFAMLYLELLQLVADMGISTAVLANRHVSDEHLPEIHGLAIASGVVGTLLVITTSPLLGRFFNAPQLPFLLVALSPTFFINSLRIVPQTLLQREFRFKWLAFLDAGQSLALSGLSIVLAVAGFGYWTLAWAALGSSVANSWAVLARKPLSPRFPNLRRLRPLLAFSSQVILQRIAWYFSSNADFAVAGKLLGKVAAGSYMLAWNFANTPLERVASLILQVSPSVLGAAAHSKDALKHHVHRATEMIALVVFPMCIGMALIARPFILLFLGSKWQAAIVPLQLIAVYTAIRSVVPLLGQVLLVVNEERYGSRVMIASAVVMTTAFVIGATLFGIVGIAGAYFVAHPFIAAAYARRALGSIGSNFREFFVDAIRPALVCTLLMVVGVGTAGQLTRNSSLALQLALEVAVGAVVYPSAVALLYRDRLRLMHVAWRMRRTAAAG